MKKADLLDEIRSELSLKLISSKEDSEAWYEDIIRILQERIAHYKAIIVYLADDASFNYYKHVGEAVNRPTECVPFGEGLLSLTAVRGEIYCDFTPNGQQIYVPFYNGHKLLGEMIIETTQFIDQAELEFIQYIHQLLSKVPN